MQNQPLYFDSHSQSLNQNESSQKVLDEQDRVRIKKQNQQKQSSEIDGEKSFVETLKDENDTKVKAAQETATTTNENSINFNHAHNRLFLPKRRQLIGSQNIDRKQLINKFTLTNMQKPQDNTLPQKQHKNLPSLGESSSLQQQVQFQRTRLSTNNNRRSLHMVAKDQFIVNKKANDFYLVKNKRRSIASQQHSSRRYNYGDSTDENKAGGRQDIYQSQTNIGKTDSSKDIAQGNGVKYSRPKIPSLKQIMDSLSNNSKRETISKSSHHHSLHLTPMKQDSLYTDPQKNSLRIVVFIKTYLLSSFQSISIEISILNNSLVIVGKLLGQQSGTLRLIVNQERSNKLVDQVNGDWEVLGRRVYVDTNGSGVKQLKIGPLKSIVKSGQFREQQGGLSQGSQNPSITVVKSKSINKQHQQLIKQRQFIKRNYYSIINNNNPNITTIPTIQPSNPSIQPIINHKQNHSNQLTRNRQESKEISPIIEIRQHLKRQNKHLDYMSPEIVRKAQEVRQEKEKKLTRSKIELQNIQKVAFLKKQNLMVQRLSKPRKEVSVGSKQEDKSREKSNIKINNVNHTESKSRGKNLQRPVLGFRLAQKKASSHIQKAHLPHELVPQISPNKDSINDAQSRIDIHISHSQFAQPNPKSLLINKNFSQYSDHENQQRDEANPTVFRSLPKTKNGKNDDAEDWKEIQMKRTDSIDQIRRANVHIEDEYSEFDQDGAQNYRKEEQLEKSLVKVYSGQIDDGEESQSQEKKKLEQRQENDYYEDESYNDNEQEYENQVSQDQSSQVIENRPNNSISRTLAPQSKPTEKPLKAKTLPKFQQQEDYEQLIPDVDDQEYQNSFEQFKQERPQTLQHPLGNIQLKQQNISEKQSQTNEYEEEIYEDQFSGSMIRDEVGLKSEKQYEENYEEQEYEEQVINKNVIEENDDLDDQQILNQIEEAEYLQEDFS